MISLRRGSRQDCWPDALDSIGSRCFSASTRNLLQLQLHDELMVDLASALACNYCLRSCFDLSDNCHLRVMLG